MATEEKAILIHDIRGAMVNHSGLQREVQDSLLQLTEVLHCLVPSSSDKKEEIANSEQASLKQQVNDILEEDIDQCLPMLKLSSERLSRLLQTFVGSDAVDKSCGNS